MKNSPTSRRKAGKIDLSLKGKTAREQSVSLLKDFDRLSSLNSTKLRLSVYLPKSLADH